MTQLTSSLTLVLALLATFASPGLVSLAHADSARVVPSAVRCYLGAQGDARGDGDASGWTCVPEHRSAQS
jgi:hypothetical protein